MKIKFKSMRCNFSASELMFTALSYATLKSSAKTPQTQREERNVQGIKQLQSFLFFSPPKEFPRIDLNLKHFEK